MMNCEEASVLTHALVDGELDAGHAREVEAHVASCARCAAELRRARELRQAMSGAKRLMPAPAALRSRIEAALGAPAEVTVPAPRPVVRPAARSRRSLLQGFAFGAALSAAAAASFVVLTVPPDQDQMVLDGVVSAHLRSLQPGHLTDVPSSNQHTVKPWFNGKLAVAPPVADLAAKDFMLVGGRLDYLEGKPVGVLVYRRRAHVINLFVAQAAALQPAAAPAETVQGFNVRRWTAEGLRFIAISDISADELQEFVTDYRAATGTTA